MKKVSIFFFLILTGILLIVFLDRSASNLSPEQKNKALIQILGRKPNINPSESKSGDSSFNGKYVSFLYPAKAKPYIQTLNGTPIPRDELENFSFDIKDPRIISVMSIEKLPEIVQSVLDYPGVKLRENQSNIYKKTILVADSLEGVSFEKKDTLGVEKTAFFYKDHNIYIFSVQGGDIVEVSEVYKKILDSVKFLK